MLHEVLRDRLMMYVNHAHIYIKKMSQKSELGAIYIVTTSLMLHWCFSL